MAEERVIAFLVEGRVWSIQRATPEKPFHPDLPWDQHPAQGPGFDECYREITGFDPAPKDGWVEYEGELVAPVTLLSPQEIQDRERDRALAELAASDLPMIRALEDLIEVLIAKGIISEADLPQAVRLKLQSRAALRVQLQA